MGKHKYRMEKNYYICQPFLTLSTRSMKKTYRILLAGFAALAVFSCNKDVKPAAPMSCEEVQKKLSDVAVATIKEGSDFESLTAVEGITFGDEQFGVALRKNSPATLEKLNAAIQKVADNGKLKEIADKYNLGEMIAVKPAA